MNIFIRICVVKAEKQERERKKHQKFARSLTLEFRDLVEKETKLQDTVFSYDVAEEA